MNIAVNESLDEAIRRRAEAAGYASPNAYYRDQGSPDTARHWLERYG